MNSVHKNNAKIFKALCDPKRLAILEMLKQGEKCACKLMEELDIAQSALSYHMKILCESKIVKGRVDGKWTHYSISKTGSEHAILLLKEITNCEDSVCETCKKSS